MTRRLVTLATLLALALPAVGYAQPRGSSRDRVPAREIAPLPERDLILSQEAPEERLPEPLLDSPDASDLSLPAAPAALAAPPQAETPEATTRPVIHPKKWTRTRDFVREVSQTLFVATSLPSASVAAWNYLFDGVRDAWRLYGFGPDITSESQIPERLRKISEPWRIEAQRQLLKDKPRKPGESFSYAWISDMERGRYPWSRLFSREPDMDEKLLREIAKLKIDFLVIGGDIVSRGTVANYYQFFKKLDAVGLKIPVFFLMGNHDDGNPHGGGKHLLFHSLLGNPNYAFDHGGVRFVFADSSAYTMERSTLRKLKTALAVPRRKHVFTHMPAAVMRDWTIIFKPLRGAGGFKKGAKEFADLMSRYNVETVFHGHIHAFARQLYHGVFYVLSGGGGSPLYPHKIKDRFYHFIKVDVGDNGHLQTVHRWDEDAQRAEPSDPIFVDQKEIKEVSRSDATEGRAARP